MQKDGVYPKYLVFKHPDYIPDEVQCNSWLGNDWEALELVEDFIFPLKPSTDRHARVALAAYAASCQGENPQLTRDILDALAFEEKP